MRTFVEQIPLWYIFPHYFDDMGDRVKGQIVHPWTAMLSRKQRESIAPKITTLIVDEAIHGCGHGKVKEVFETTIPDPVFVEASPTVWYE